jgi:hypothetical protein
MLRKMIVVTAAVAVLGAVALAPADASAAHRKRGARGGFHGADIYYPEFYTPIFAGGSIYCWHWFRVGRGWARAWAC